MMSASPESGEAEADPPLVRGLPRLLGQRPDRRGQHVIEHPDGATATVSAKRVAVESGRLRRERVA